MTKTTTKTTAKTDNNTAPALGAIPKGETMDRQQIERCGVLGPVVFSTVRFPKGTPGQTLEKALQIIATGRHVFKLCEGGQTTINVACFNAHTGRAIAHQAVPLTATAVDFVPALEAMVDAAHREIYPDGVLHAFA